MAIMDEIIIYRNINYIYVIRTVLSMAIVFFYIELLKDRRAMVIGALSILIGIFFECFAVVIGLRVYTPNDYFHSFMLVLLLAIEIGGAAALIWSASTLIHDRPKDWQKKLAIWGLIALCISIVFPLIAGG
jgi:hypothetical protein